MTNAHPNYIGQWFHPLLNPIAYEDLEDLVANATDIEIRRHNHRVGNQFSDISSKLETMRFHTKSVADRLEFARSKLPLMLADLKFELGESTKTLKDKAVSSMIVEFRDHILVAHLEAILIQVKALLDSLVQFYSIAFERTMKTFSAKGTGVIKDVKNLGGIYSSSKSTILELLQSAKSLWINEVIDYRDQVVHFGQLRSFSCQQLTILESVNYQPEEVEESKMPNGIKTDLFCQNLMTNAHTFSAEWLRITFEALKSRNALGTSVRAIGS